MKYKPYNKVIKPFLDRLIALVAFIILSPVILLVTVLLIAFQNGNVFFTQPRPGYKERVFRLVKFKTMTDKRDKEGYLLPDDQRITRVGKFIRKTSLDEMPQLINILKGDMSFIGPRPWLVEYLELYTDEQRKRHDVKPGITGWAQVHGRNTLDWEQRFEYDLSYVKHQSMWLDIKILFLTIIKVFRAEGISREGHVTMEKFRGNKEA